MVLYWMQVRYSLFVIVRWVYSFTHETESPGPVHFKHSHWWKRHSWSKFASHYAWGTNGVCECKWIPTCKGHTASYIASNGLCFMVTWTIFKNHLLEVGLTQNREIMVFWTLTTIDLFYFMMCEDTHEEIHWNSIWLRTRSHMTSQYAWGSVTPLHTWFWRCVGTAFGHFLLGSDNFMVTALGSCMKWPSHMIGRPWHSERSEPLVYSILSCVRTRMNINPLK